MKKEDNKRRIFLKKLAYKAPIIMILGQLVKPKSLKADSQVEGPPDGGFPTGF